MPTRSDLARAFVPNSPFAQRLALTIERLDADGAELRMPFDPELATVGDTVHGGAIASLIDTAAVTAAWGDDSPAQGLGGATVSMSVDYVAAARDGGVRRRPGARPALGAALLRVRGLVGARRSPSRAAARALHRPGARAHPWAARRDGRVHRRRARDPRERSHQRDAPRAALRPRRRPRGAAHAGAARAERALI